MMLWQWLPEILAQISISIDPKNDCDLLVLAAIHKHRQLYAFRLIWEDHFNESLVFQCQTYRNRGQHSSHIKLNFWIKLVFELIWEIGIVEIKLNCCIWSRFANFNCHRKCLIESNYDLGECDFPSMWIVCETFELWHGAGPIESFFYIDFN